MNLDVSTVPREMPNFSTLPREMQQEFMLYLPISDIANYCFTSKAAIDICTDDYFWVLKMNHDFPGISQY